MRRLPLTLALALLGVGLFLVAYWPALAVPFVYDDLAEIVSNPAIHDLKDLKAILDYNPARVLLLFTFAIQWALHGANPLPYHALNLALHGLSAGLVFLLGRRLLRVKSAPATPLEWANLGPLLASLIFLLHPLFVETVTYIASRSSGLCALLYLGAVLAYCRFRDEAQRGEEAWPYYLLTLALTAAAVATKEIAATLPAALILADRLLVPAPPAERPPLSPLRRWGPLALPFAFLGGMIALRFAIAGELMGGTMVRSIGENLLTETKVVGIYLLRFIYPSPLSIYHDVQTLQRPDAATLAAIAIHGGLITISLRGLWRKEIYAFPILWFYLTLLPSSSVVPLKEAMAEHRTYLPGMGLLAGLGALLPLTSPKARRAIVALGIGVMLTFGLLTHRYNQLWTNEVALWQHATTLAPHSGDAFYALGDAYRRGGNLEAAITAYETSVDRYESQGVHLKEGRRGEVVVYNYPDALNNLGLAYAMKGDLDRAIPTFRRAARAYPNLSAKAYTNLGYALIQRGQFQSAEVALIQAIEAEPGSVLAHWHLANLYYGFLGQPQKSLEHYQAVLALDPAHPGREALQERILELSY